MNHNIKKALLEDIPQLEALINSAYRGEASKQGWTTEADLLEGSLRTDEESLHQLMNQPDSVVLKYTDDSGNIIGCVYLQKQKDKLYLGMLTVSPGKQSLGIGKQLLHMALQYASESGCPIITMNVISLRTELIAWYERHGYKKTGETRPFPDDTKFGKPTRELQFVVLERECSD